MPPPPVPRAGARISAAADAVNGSLGLAEIIGIPLAIGLAVLLIVIIIAVRRKKESDDDGEQEKPLDPDSDTEGDGSPRGSFAETREARNLRQVIERMESEDRRREELEQRQRDWAIQPLSPLPAVAVRGRG